jgi:hypothetical protein
MMMLSPTANYDEDVPIASSTLIVGADFRKYTTSLDA